MSWKFWQQHELPLTVLKYRDYRLIWAGQAVSTMGTWMHSIALSWQVYEITNSLALLGLLGLIRAVATMLTSLFGGALADTMHRRHLLVVTNSMLIVLSGGLALLTELGLINVVILYVAAGLVAAVSSFDSPARAALVPTLVPRRRIADAMSFNILTSNAAEMVGPALGGFAVGTIGVAGAYSIDAMSFIAVVIAVLFIRADMSSPVKVKRGNVAAIAEGLRFIKLTPVIYAVMLLDFGATFFGSVTSLTPAFAQDIFNVGPEGFGLLNAAPAVGAVLAGAALSVLPTPQRPGWLIVSAVAAYGVFRAALGISPDFWFALVMLGGYGAADAVSMTMRHTIRNLATPNELRGRVAATNSAFSSGGPRLGEFGNGLLASAIGVRETTVVGGAGILLVVGAIAWKLPSVLRYDLDEAGDEEPEAEVAD